MRPVAEGVSKPRCALYETLEDRLVLSAASLADCFARRSEAPAPEQPQHAEVTTLADTLAQGGVSAVRSAYGFTGQGQTVAVIDSGIAYDQNALGHGFGAGHRVVGGWDFAENDANPYDDGPAGFHGTHVAGIIGSSDSRYSGVAPGADLVALRVFDDLGNSNFAWVESALKWVHQHRNDFASPITTVNLSIGTSWNANNVPNWATLEEEFAQLKADGIFISVAAGNSFASYKTPGVSYPAASPYVTPVASVGDSGLLSNFSQRNSRVIAAPGEKIMSTVPDWLFGGDGTPNDFMSASGTSMAAPYVAGASVLLRQAMQFAGYQNINEDMLYNTMYNTADMVFDSVTNASYHRLNLQRAIDSVMPARSTSPTTDLGTIDSKQVAGQNLSSGDAWFKVTASRSGTFTAEALFAQAGGNIDLELCDANKQVLAKSATGNNFERIDVTATAGQTFYLHVKGANSNVSLRLTNLVSENGNQVNVYGTAGNDTFTFVAGANPTVTVNGTSYKFTSVKTAFAIQGGAGTDSLAMTGTAAKEDAILRAGSAQYSGFTFRAQASGMENVSITSGGGGDTARLYDSAGDDQFSAGPASATLRGSGYTSTANGFSSVMAYASTGNDSAQFLDSAGADRFVGYAGYSFMSGTGFYNFASGFKAVTANSTSGADRAELYGTAGNDSLLRTNSQARLSGAGYSNTVVGFGSFRSFGGAGVDQAVFRDIGGGDYFYGRTNNARLSRTGLDQQAYDFESVTATAASGQTARSDVQAVNYIFNRLGQWQ